MTALLVLALAALPVAAGADVERVDYLDENGDKKTVNATVFDLSSSDPYHWGDGWYVITSTTEVNTRIYVEGQNVFLILCDGVTLTANKGINVGSSSDLTIYAQSTGDNMGKLIATGNDGCAGIGGDDWNKRKGGDCGYVTINGGYITATGGERGGAGIGGGAGIESSGQNTGGAGGKVTINGGVVTATGGGWGGAGIGGGVGYGGAGSGDSSEGGAGSTVTINGGVVTATGGETDGTGIGGGRGYDRLISEGKITIKGIGGEGGTVTINGGVVTATGSGVHGVAIGDGYGSDRIRSKGYLYFKPADGKAIIATNLKDNSQIGAFERSDDNQISKFTKVTNAQFELRSPTDVDAVQEEISKLPNLPRTGDSSGLLLWAALAALCALGAAALLAAKRKRG